MEIINLGMLGKNGHGVAPACNETFFDDPGPCVGCSCVGNNPCIRSGGCSDVSELPPNDPFRV